MSKNENDILNLNIIPKHKWIDHYKALLSNDNVNADHSNTETNHFITYKGELKPHQWMSLKNPFEELNIEKQQDRMGLTAELFKYGGILLKLRLLQLQYIILSLIHI